jgi:hypothetical protein
MRIEAPLDIDFKCVYLIRVQLHCGMQVARDKLTMLGVQIGRLTSHTGKFRLGIGCMDLLAQYAKYKVCLLALLLLRSSESRKTEHAYLDGGSCTQAPRKGARVHRRVQRSNAFVVVGSPLYTTAVLNFVWYAMASQSSSRSRALIVTRVIGQGAPHLR